jgi:hypothetical protein
VTVSVLVLADWHQVIVAKLKAGSIAFIFFSIAFV